MLWSFEFLFVCLFCVSFTSEIHNLLSLTEASLESSSHEPTYAYSSFASHELAAYHGLRMRGSL